MKDFDYFTKNEGDMGKKMLPQALKSCPMCNKLHNLVTLWRHPKILCGQLKVGPVLANESDDEDHCCWHQNLIRWMMIGDNLQLSPHCHRLHEENVDSFLKLGDALEASLNFKLRDYNFKVRNAFLNTPGWNFNIQAFCIFFTLNIIVTLIWRDYDVSWLIKLFESYV